MESLSKGKAKVVFDSSMLLVIERFKVDIFQEIRELLGRTEFYITEAIERELNSLQESNAKEVKIARELMEKNSVKVVKTKAEKGDESLIEKALQGMIVASNDKELRKRIKAFGGKLIYLRKKKLIKIE